MNGHGDDLSHRRYHYLPYEIELPYGDTFYCDSLHGKVDPILQINKEGKPVFICPKCREIEEK